MLRISPANAAVVLNSLLLIYLFIDRAQKETEERTYSATYGAGTPSDTADIVIYNRVGCECRRQV